MNLFYNFFLFTSLFFYCNGLEYNKQQRYNPSTDFLLHESGGTAWTKKDDVALPNNDYNAQFPSLGSPRLPTTTTAQTTLKSAFPSQKQDLVSSQITAQKTPNDGKRDYVANKLPIPNPQPPINRDSYVPQVPNGRPQPTGIRNYVAPQQLTTQKPSTTNVGTGKVKDLINFFDSSKPKDQSGAQKVPSYSNILQGNNNSKMPTQSVTTRSTQPPPTKPLSFSAIVGGSSKPTPNTYTTQKPSSPITGQGNLRPTIRPGSVVLPSSLINSSKNSNQASNGLSDAEIQVLSEELFRKDTNNAAKYITVNYQQKTTSQSKDDKAPQPLLTVASEAWNIPTIQKLLPLLDNYEKDTMVNEYVTAQERNEENAFMDTIMNSAVVRHLMNFLKERGYVSPDPRTQRDFLKQLWFNLYSRGKGKISSSGFEHVFVSELKNGDVQGLHNWVYFSREEAANRVNYLGYLKYQQLDDKGAVLKFHFNQQGVDKPVNTIFIGTSPELEIALYTLCFVTRADNDCKLKLGSKDINIVTHTFRYRSKNYIGSAYPQI